MAAVAQSLVVSGSAGLTFTNSPTATDFVIPEAGLSFPDFDIANTYGPDSDDVPGAVLTAWAMRLGSMPLVLDVKGTDLSDLQTNRRALEACFAQVGETVTLNLGDEAEEYPMFPSWPKWGVVNSGGLVSLILTANLTVPVNPMVAT